MVPEQAAATDSSRNPCRQGGEILTAILSRQTRLRLNAAMHDGLLNDVPPCRSFSYRVLNRFKKYILHIVRAPEGYEPYFGGLGHLECGGVAAKA